MAALRLADGVPDGVTHLRVRRTAQGAEPITARVDLVDAAGRRWTIWENAGYARDQRPGDVAWLALEDFHLYAWGRIDGRRRLRAEDVREVQLRFYARRAGARLAVELEWATPRQAGCTTSVAAFQRGCLPGEK